MRVTGGELAGRRIGVPRRGMVRPTADRVRESLFARLGDLVGQRVLDLFAGSGALGIEALSRGAESAVFVDAAGACTRKLRSNLESLGLAPRAKVLRGWVPSVLQRLEHEGAPFDLVFLDPPYASGEATPTLQRLARGDLLGPEGMVVLETHRRHAPGPVAGLRRTDERRYGDTLIVHLVRCEGDGRVP